jgi:hypothetical protein
LGAGHALYSACNVLRDESPEKETPLGSGPRPAVKPKSKFATKLSRKKKVRAVAASQLREMHRVKNPSGVLPQIQIGREGIAGADDDIFLSESDDDEAAEGEGLDDQFEPSAVQLCNR